MEITKKEAEFILNLIMLAGNAYPKLRNDKEFMSAAKSMADKIMENKKDELSA